MLPFCHSRVGESETAMEHANSRLRYDLLNVVLELNYDKVSCSTVGYEESGTGYCKCR